MNNLLLLMPLGSNPHQKQHSPSAVSILSSKFHGGQLIFPFSTFLPIAIATMSVFRQLSNRIRMASFTLLQPCPFSLFGGNIPRAISVHKNSRIIPVACFARYSSNIVMTSTHSGSGRGSRDSSCSLQVHDSSEHSRSLGSDEADMLALDGTTKVESPHSARTNLYQYGMQEIPWGDGCLNLGTGINDPVQWPQNLTHRVPNIRDLVAVDASEIVEPVLEDETKLQNGGDSSTPRQDGQPSKRSVKRAANHEKRKATRKAAKQRESADQWPVRESRLHEDGLPTCLSSSSDDDLIPGHPSSLHTINERPNQSSQSNISTRSTQSEEKKTLPKFHRQLYSTQAGVGDMEDLTSRTENVSVADTSNPDEASQLPISSETTSIPTSQNPNQSQPQQKKEKKPKASKQPAAPTTLPLSPALIDLRVGHILRCIPHENADSLYVSTIAMGDAEGTDNTHKDEGTGRIVRTVCSGLRGLIPIEEMQDRKVIVMANLKPVTMRGIKSAAMVLAASPPPKAGEDAHAADRVVELVGPPEGSEGGNRVYFEGFEYGEGKGPEKVLNPKKKQWENVQPGLFTSEELTVVFDAGRVQGVEGGKGELVVEGVQGKCKVPSLKGAKLS
jgi:tRNA-binding EMAP/Myf-like protein